jgi:hypothetical protein
MELLPTPMTNAQLYLAIGVPIAANALIMLLFTTMVGARLTSFENAINKRFDDLRDLWRAELHRVEEVLDARLKHIEESH